jgi:uncharacterized membrane protein YgcG
MKIRKPYLSGVFKVIAVLAVLAVPGLLQAAPQPSGSRQILHFNSHIQIHPDSSMTVTETITYETGVRRHGIVREFPTTYRDARGNTITVGFKVLEVLRDQNPEPYHIKTVTNGEKVYIGKKDHYLSPGVYTYVIKYRTDRQLGFFEDHDELYWNVTGNGWDLPILAAEALIEAPPGGKVLKYAAYTGYQGEKGRDFIMKAGETEVRVKTTRPLNPRQGLSVVVAWPKGVVQRPSGLDKAGFLFRDNLSSLVGLLGLVLLLGYYLVIWARVGRDPASGTVIPLYTPPKDLSPAGVRFLMNQGFDNKVMAAAVVDMAVKGYLTIEEKEDGLLFLKSRTYTLRKKRDSYDDLSGEEMRAAAHLFGGGDAIELKSENHTAIKSALDAVKETLQVKMEKHYFITNLNYFIIGVLLTLAILAVIVLTSARPEAIISALWLTGWTVGCAFLAVVVYRRWLAARGAGFGKVLGALALTLFALPFFIGEVVGAGFLGYAISPLAAVAFAGMVFANPLFYYLLKAPTLAGRGLMDQIEGFKLFLSVAEKERLNLLNPPERTPELFEKYLPYALALDVEVQWTEQFAEMMARAGAAYAPVWYSGRSFQDSYSYSNFSSDLGSSFSDGISSSSAAPGSSSGFGGGGGGGGGGSGGGGGGGGGGDW